MSPARPRVPLAMVVLDPLPLAELAALHDALVPLLGEDGIMDAALAAELGVRFAFRGRAGPTAEAVRAAREVTP